MNTSNATEEAMLKRNEILTEVGEQIYLQYRNNEITVTPEIEEVLKQIAPLDVIIGQANGSYNKSLTNCPQCQEQLAENAVFCSKCGCSIQEYQKANEKKCSNCGATVYAQNYCVICGSKIQEKEGKE